MMQKEIFEAVCAEFHDNYFEDKWHEIPENSIMKAGTRNAMHKALLKLWELRLTNDSKVEAGK